MMLRHVNSLHLAYILVFAELTSFVQRIHVVEPSLKYRFIAAYKVSYNMVYRSNYRLYKTTDESTGLTQTCDNYSGGWLKALPPPTITCYTVFSLSVHK